MSGTTARVRQHRIWKFYAGRIGSRRMIEHFTNAERSGIERRIAFAMQNVKE